LVGECGVAPLEHHLPRLEDDMAVDAHNTEILGVGVSSD
jgi:hypothetical protein